MASSTSQPHRRQPTTAIGEAASLRLTPAAPPTRPAARISSYDTTATSTPNHLYTAPQPQAAATANRFWCLLNNANSDSNTANGANAILPTLSGVTTRRTALVRFNRTPPGATTRPRVLKRSSLTPQPIHTGNGAAIGKRSDREQQHRGGEPGGLIHRRNDDRYFGALGAGGESNASGVAAIDVKRTPILLAFGEQLWPERDRDGRQRRSPRRNPRR